MQRLVYVITIPLLLLAASTVPALAWATNESSYNAGYKNAMQVAKCTATQVFTNNGDDCGRGEVSYYWTCGIQNPSDTGDISAVTNKTACDDGAVNGFVHWCSTDNNGCAAVIKSGGVDLNGTVYQQQLKSDTGKDLWQIMSR
jgi:hypothetical protein